MTEPLDAWRTYLGDTLDDEDDLAQAERDVGMLVRELGPEAAARILQVPGHEPWPDGYDPAAAQPGAAGRLQAELRELAAERNHEDPGDPFGYPDRLPW